MAPHSDDDDTIESGIGLTVAAGGEPVTRELLPLEVGIGQAPHSLAKAASDRMRSGLSPTRISISAAVPVEMP